MLKCLYYSLCLSHFFAGFLNFTFFSFFKTLNFKFQKFLWIPQNWKKVQFLKRTNFVEENNFDSLERHDVIRNVMMSFSEMLGQGFEAPSICCPACFYAPPTRRHWANYTNLMLDTTENTHCRVKDHCTAGLQFNKIGFDQKRKYVVFVLM